MSVSLEAGIIRLSGACGIEDTEPLLGFLQAGAVSVVDLTGAGHLHAAVVQLLLAFRPELNGPAGDSFVQTWMMPLFARNKADGQT